jgi:hypothetical protein
VNAQLSLRRVPPFIRAAVVVLVAASATACNRGDTLPGGGPTAPSAPATGTATITGLVLVHDGNGVNVYQYAPVTGVVLGTGPLPVYRDATGRYIFRPAVGSRLRLYADLDNHYQPCVITHDVRGDATQDVHVVSDVRQLGASLPPELLANGPLLSGVVYERTAGGRTPLSQANVMIDGSLVALGIPIARTVTDANGRFVFCGVTESEPLLFSWKDGYLGKFYGVPASGNAAIEIELTR